MQYINTEFKGLVIGSDILTQSIDNICQLKELQQLNIFIQLNKNTARSANFIFGIKSTAFIGLIILNTSMGSITFYIILVNTLYLLCVADIDKFRIFFNNITN